MADFIIDNPPAFLDMNAFWAINKKYHGPAKTARYVVRIYTPRALTRIDNDNKFELDQKTSITRDLSYLCEATELPGRAFQNLDLRYYGPQFKMPFMSQYEDINMTFICRTNSMERQFFDDWMETINPTSSWDFRYRDEYSTSIELFQMSEYETSDDGTNTPRAEYQFTLFDAFPIMVHGQPVTWAEDSIQKLTVTFTYTKWKRNKRDLPKPLGRYHDWESSTAIRKIP